MTDTHLNSRATDAAAVAPSAGETSPAAPAPGTGIRIDGLS